MKDNKKFSLVINLLIVYIAWSSTYLAIRFAVETMPPFLMAGTRFLVAGAILYIWRRLAGDPAPTGREWRAAAVIGVLLLVFGNGGVSWAEQYVVSGVAALVVGSVPLFMVLIGAFSPLASLRDRAVRRPGWKAYVGIVIGFAGVALLISPADFNGNGTNDPVGMLVLLLASLAWAAGSLYSREAKLPASPLLGTGMEMLVGGVGLYALGTLAGEWGRLDLGEITAVSLWSLGYLIVFGALLGFASYTWLLRNAPTPLVSTYAYVNPLLAVFLGFFLANEPLTPRILIAALVIASSVAFITQERVARRRRMVAPALGDD